MLNCPHNHREIWQTTHLRIPIRKQAYSRCDCKQNIDWGYRPLSTEIKVVCSIFGDPSEAKSDIRLLLMWRFGTRCWVSCYSRPFSKKEYISWRSAQVALQILRPENTTYWFSTLFSTDFVRGPAMQNTPNVVGWRSYSRFEEWPVAILARGKCVLHIPWTLYFGRFEKFLTNSRVCHYSNYNIFAKPTNWTSRIRRVHCRDHLRFFSGKENERL